jgi:flavin reductase (DIM6/NTAB) family NADH-FMN oxidoreductase RutF
MIKELKDVPVAQIYNWLQQIVAPRPIGLMSTIHKDGQTNLTALSFLHLVSANAPVLLFSPVRKETENLSNNVDDFHEIEEAVIHIVTEELIQQTVLASCEFPSDVDDFERAGFTKEEAKMVRPATVKECPVKLECKVKQIQLLGEKGELGKLIIAEVVCMHIDETIMNADLSMIDQCKFNLVAKFGADRYCRINEQSLFKLTKPAEKFIGFKRLPDPIRNSKVLTPNDLALLASVEVIPGYPLDCLSLASRCLPESRLHHYAQVKLREGKVKEAWGLLMYEDAAE